MNLKNKTNLTLGFTVGIISNKEATTSGLLKSGESVEIPNEEILIIHNATLGK